MDLPEVTIYTDGACRGNPGPGGWSAIIISGNTEKVIAGGEKDTTNNRMELKAIIGALQLLTRRCRVNVFSDSKYVVDGLSRGWAMSWQSRGWKKSDGKPALNANLWEKLLRLCEKHDVNVTWVEGHNGNYYNERCDRLAVSFAEAFSSN